jgi:hypothetical protein
MRYYIKEVEHLKKTVVYVIDEFGHHQTVAAYYWLVHGRQGAWQKAHNKYQPRRENA